jgi:hypothetical protein
MSQFTKPTDITQYLSKIRFGKRIPAAECILATGRWLRDPASEACSVTLSVCLSQTTEWVGPASHELTASDLSKSTHRMKNYHMKLSIHTSVTYATFTPMSRIRNRGKTIYSCVQCHMVAAERNV